MEKNEKTRKIVLWSLFGVLVVITIIGFIFAKEIYGWSEVIDEGMGPEIVCYKSTLIMKQSDISVLNLSHT